MGRREDLVAAVRARVGRIGDTQDFSLAFTDEALAEADELVGILREEPTDVPVRHALGWLYYTRQLVLPPEKGRLEREMAVSLFEPVFALGYESVPSELRAVLAERTLPTAETVLDWADERTADAAVELAARILVSLPTTHAAWAPLVRRAGECAALAPASAAYLSVLAKWFWQAAQQSDGPQDLNATVTVLEALLVARPQGHPERAWDLSELGLALRERYKLTGNPDDLEAAAERGRAAVAATSDDPTYRAELADHYDNLTATLVRQYEADPTDARLGAALDAARRTREGTPADSARLRDRTVNVSVLHLAAYRRTGDLSDFSAAVDAQTAVLDLTAAEDAAWPRHAARLGALLWTRYELQGDEVDLRRAVSLLRKALPGLPPADDARISALTDLGGALLGRHQRWGDPVDLDEAAQLLGEAVNAPTAGGNPSVTALVNLGAVLWTRHQLTGDSQDLGDAIGHLEAAAASLSGPGRLASGAHGNLSAALLARYELSGDRQDVEDAVAHGRTAASHVPAGGPDHAERLSHLGKALHRRYEVTGSAQDLKEAVRVLATARDTLPEAHPKRLMALSTLAITLHTRYEQSGALADLADAITAHRAAADLVLPGNPLRPVVFSDLAAVLWTSYERTGRTPAVNEAVRLLGAALEATPDRDPQRPGRLGNLAVVLQARFRRLGDPADLNGALDAARAAHEATPPGHPDHAMHANNLAGVLLLHGEQTPAPTLGGSASGADGPDEAVRVAQAAAETTPPGSPARAGYLSVLGNALRTRYDTTGAPEDREAAANAWEQAAQADASAPFLRIRAARALASLVHGTDLPRARRALEDAVWLLPYVAPRHLERHDQYHALGGVSGLAGDAAALVLTDTTLPSQERPERALTILEAGRSVLLSQALDTRGDLTELREQDADLAARYTELRSRLDQAPGTPLTTAISIQPAAPLSQDQRRRWVEELDELLGTIRSLPNLSGFAAPPSREEMLDQACEGPIVTINVSHFGSHALILTAEGVSAVELPALTPRDVARRVDAFQYALRVAADRKASGVRRLAAQRQLTRHLAWLWTGAAAPVLAELGYDAPPEDLEKPEKPLPRIWWAPGGLLGMLPLHAAGLPDGPSLLDRVVSSYTPTVRALRHARARDAAPGDTRAGSAPVGSGLIVCMPVTPGLGRDGRGELKHAAAEAAAVGRHLPEAAVYATSAEEADSADDPPPWRRRSGPPPTPPTRAAVLAELPGRSVAHFTCHAVTHCTDPARSGLLLADHSDGPLTVADLAATDLDRARLAYLSACTTATSRTADLLDEAIHLASAFQLAGFPQVVGTLWNIQDASAAHIAEAFYAALADDEPKDQRRDLPEADESRAPEPLDTTRSARALHAAVRALRREVPRLPSLWAAHVHSGA